MQSVRLRLKVQNHRITEELPPEVPDGEADVVIHFEEDLSASLHQLRRRHLEALFAGLDRHSPNRSREDIDRQVAEERANWGGA